MTRHDKPLEKGDEVLVDWHDGHPRSPATVMQVCGEKVELRFAGEAYNRPFVVLSVTKQLYLSAGGAIVEITSAASWLAPRAAVWGGWPACAISRCFRDASRRYSDGDCVCDEHALPGGHYLVPPVFVLEQTAVTHAGVSPFCVALLVVHARNRIREREINRLVRGGRGAVQRG